MLAVEIGVSAENVRNYLAMCGVPRATFLDGDLAIESKGSSDCVVYIGESVPAIVGRALSELSDP